MKQRPKGFLAEYFEEPQKDPEIASYIQECHELLWGFVRCEFPWASGNLGDYVVVALESAKHRSNKREESK